MFKSFRSRTAVILMVIVMTVSLIPAAVYAADGWNQDQNGWQYLIGDSCYKNQWALINGKWYYFNETGYMESNCYRDGYWLSASGAWDPNYSHGMWKKNSIGWWYEDNGWYPVSRWLWINGKCYYFNEKGYMESSCYRDGCWLTASGAWDPRYSNGTWKSDATGTWYEDNGWRPVNQTLQIDGVVYTFDAEGKVVTSPSTVLMPDVMGMYYQDAIDYLKTTLKDAGFETVNIQFGWTFSNHDPEMATKIVSQNPPAGTVLNVADKTITVTIYAAEWAPTPTSTPTKKPTATPTKKPTGTPTPTPTTKPTATPTVVPVEYPLHSTASVYWNTTKDSVFYEGYINDVPVHKDSADSYWKFDDQADVRTKIEAAINKAVPGGYDVNNCYYYHIDSVAGKKIEPETEYRTVIVNWSTTDFDNNHYEGTIPGVGVHRDPGHSWDYDNVNDVKAKVKAAIDKAIPGGWDECAGYAYNF